MAPAADGVPSIVEPRKLAKCRAAIVVQPLQSPAVQHLYSLRIVISGSADIVAIL